MCGIAGVVGSTEGAQALLAGVAHRGPDARALWLGRRVAIGAARLRTVGDARSDQPIASASGRLRLVGNAEIFNWRDLGGAAPGQSDLTTWLEHFERVGEVAFSAIRGPFALAIVDTVDERVWLARDEWGVRPLFVRRESAGLAFASEIEPLLARGPVLRDERGWDALLAFQFSLPGRSPWQDLHPVAPGTWLSVRLRDGGQEIDQGQFRCIAGADAPLEQAAREAFRLQGRAPGRVGLTLSGGLDSSVVAGSLVREGLRPDVAAVGWFPEGGPELDERPHARAVAEELGIELLEVPITGDAYRAAWSEVLARLGGPVAGPGSVSQYLVARALREEGGARFVFSGQGGDELFGGYERHRQLLQLDLGRPRDPAPGYEQLLPEGTIDPAARLLFRGADLLPHLEPERAGGVMAAATALPRPGADLAERVLAFELRVLLPGLLHVEDATVAAFGMEGRVPFLDPVLAGSARSRPLVEKSPPDTPRRLFRELFAPVLPVSAARRRDKMGFPVPLSRWLAGPLRDLVEDASIQSHLADLGLRPSGCLALRAGRLPPRLSWFLLASALALETLGTAASRAGRQAS